MNLKIVVFFLLFIGCVRAFGEYNREDLLKKILNENENYFSNEIEKPFKYYEVLNENKEVIYYAVFSDDIKTTKTGMRGKIPLMIVFDAEKNIKQIEILENRETEVQFERVVNSNILEKMMNYNKNKKEKIDIPAGATYTGNAIINGIKSTVDKFRKIK